MSNKYEYVYLNSYVVSPFWVAWKSETTKQNIALWSVSIAFRYNHSALIFGFQFDSLKKKYASKKEAVLKIGKQGFVSKDSW